VLNIFTAEKIFLASSLLFAFFTPIAKVPANIAMTISIITGLILARKYHVDFKNLVKEPLIKPLLLFFFMLLVTVPFSVNVFISLHEYLRMLPYVFPFVIFIILKLVKDKFEINVGYIFHAFLCGSLIASIYAIYQYVHTKQLYVTSFFGHHAIFGSYLEMALPIIAVLFLRELSLRKKLIYVLSGMICFIALILTQARGPWIATFAALLTIACIMRIHINVNKKIIIISVTILLASAFLTMPLYLDRAKTITDISWPSNYHRLLIWESTLHMIEDYPATGVGLGQFIIVYNEQYISPLSLERSHPHAHNSYLMLCAESGIGALLAFMYLLLKIGQLLLSLLRSGSKRGYAVAYTGVFVAIIVNSLVDNFFWSPYISKIVWLMLGLVIYEGHSTKSDIVTAQDNDIKGT
jgi:O-antigen ligase